MSLSQAGDELKTTMVSTASSSGGTEVSRAIDATEDREIKGINITIEDVGSAEVHNCHTNIYTGNDPFAGSDYNNDNESFVMSYDFTQNYAAGDSVGLGGGKASETENFQPIGFPWDEHVTLTVEHTELAANSSNAEVMVYWVEV